MANCSTGIFWILFFFLINGLVTAAPRFEEGDIRLVGGRRRRSEGTVLIYHSGHWGSICDRGFDIRDANTVCRQLGFERALQSLRRSPFGIGRRRRWLTGLRCHGHERRLRQCVPSWGIRRDYYYCSRPSRSAGVICLPQTTVPSTTTTTTTTTTPPTTSRTTASTSTATPSTSSTTSKDTVVSNISISLLGSSQHSPLLSTKYIETTKYVSTTMKPKLISADTSLIKTTSLSNVILDSNSNNEIPLRDPGIVSDNSILNSNEISRNNIYSNEIQSAHLQQDNDLNVNRVTRDHNENEINSLQGTTSKTTTSATTRPAMDMKIDPTTKLQTPIPSTPKSTTRDEPKTTTLIRSERSTPDVSSRQSQYDDEVYAFRLRPRKWMIDKLLNSWVRLTYRGKVLIAKRGERPKKITKEEYYERRRQQIIKERGEVVNIVENSTPKRVTESKPTSFPTIKTTTSKPTTTVHSTSKQIPTTTLKSTTPKATKSTTVKPSTTTKTTTQKTIKSTTVKPSTTSPTTTSKQTTLTVKPSTTTVIPSTTSPTTTPKQTTPVVPTTTDRYYAEVYSVRMRPGKWFKDDLLKSWVLLSTQGKMLIAEYGRRSKRITKTEYYRRRREKIIERHAEEEEEEERMKADDPSVGGGQSTSRPAAAPAPSRVLSMSSSGESNVVISGSTSGGMSSNSSVNKVLNGSHRRHRHRHRHGDGDDIKSIRIRMAGSRSNRGRLEILPPGKQEWGVICGDKWTMKEAIVACRGLGNGYAVQPVTRSTFGGRNQRKYIAAVRCSGREKRLQDCQWQAHDGVIQCSRPQSVAGVICATALPDLEPSISMLETTAFLQDRHLYYLQCAMEEKCLAPSAYERQRSRGWRQSTRRLLRFSSVVKNIGTADFRPNVDRSQWEWHACHMHYHSMDVFAHYDVLDDYGNRIAEGLKASFCLEDSACNQGIHPRYSCQNYGHQGISVGCSDNYMSDIDCQWIDITDVKPGKYKLKIEVNPNMLVAEISFENNVIHCDLTYTGYYARIHNCSLKSLL